MNQQTTVDDTRRRAASAVSDVAGDMNSRARDRPNKESAEQRSGQWQKHAADGHRLVECLFANKRKENKQDKQAKTHRHTNIHATKPGKHVNLRTNKRMSIQANA